MNQQALATQLQAKLDSKTKPQGALGKIEQVAHQIGLIQQTLTPAVDKPRALVFAADHGICAAGVNPFPQVVTEQMVSNFVAGGAAMSVFCASNQIPLSIINMGLVNPAAHWPEVLDRTIAAGTRNFATQAAMTVSQCQQAIGTGRALVQQSCNQGHNLLLIGEMGIGNSTSAAALLAALTNTPPELAVGPGTGASSTVIAKKIDVIDAVLPRCQNLSAQQILAEVGGFEIAAMTGVLLAAREHGIAVLVDGFIASVAALAAAKISPASKANWLFAHRSAEPGHSHLLAELDATPLLDLALRLGEGTGAALAYPLLKCAVDMLNQMASFEQAGVSQQ